MDADEYNAMCARENARRRSRSLGTALWCILALAALLSPLWVPWAAHLLRGH